MGKEGVSGELDQENEKERILIFSHEDVSLSPSLP